jgi:hypothetical protein
MATAREFVTLAMKEAGVIGMGQTPNAEDINDCFTLLTRMLNLWQKKRWVVPNLIDVSAVGNDRISNLIGPGQHYNSLRPDKIQAAYFKQVGGGFSSGFDSGFDSSINNDVSYFLTPIWSYEDYSRIGLKNLISWPSYYFYDGAFPYGNVFIWPVPSSRYEIHLLVKGPIGFKIVLLSGSIEDAGSSYIDNTYLAVPLTNINSFGGGATATITVAGGIVTNVEIINGGDGYKINDTLSVSNIDLGGVGSGFVYRVNNVTSSLDAEFNMPEDYEEPIHHNLTRRIIAHYQYPPNLETNRLAIAGLNSIKNSNLQISKLIMPSSLRFGNSNGFNIFNADAY